MPEDVIRKPARSAGFVPPSNDSRPLTVAPLDVEDHHAREILSADRDRQRSDFRVAAFGTADAHAERHPVAAARRHDLHRACLQRVVSGRDAVDREVAVLVGARGAAERHQAGLAASRDGVDHRPFDGLAVRADHHPRDLREPHGQQREIGALGFLAGRDRQPLRVGAVGGAGKIRRGVSGVGARPRRASDRTDAAAGRGSHHREVHHHRVARAQRGADVIVARRQAVNAVLTEIVGLRRTPGRLQLPSSCRPRRAHRAHHRVGDRLAELVEHPSRDHAAARHRDLRLVEDLPVDELDRLS